MSKQLTMRDIFIFMATLSNQSQMSFKQQCEFCAQQGLPTSYIASYLAERPRSGRGAATVVDLVLKHQFYPFYIDLLYRRLTQEGARLTFLQFEGVKPSVRSDVVSAIISLSTRHAGIQVIQGDQPKTVWNNVGVEMTHPLVRFTPYDLGNCTAKGYERMCSVATLDGVLEGSSFPAAKKPLILVAESTFVRELGTLHFVRAAIAAGSSVVLVADSYSDMKTYWDGLCAPVVSGDESPLNFKKNATFIHPKTSGKDGGAADITYSTLLSHFK